LNFEKKSEIYTSVHYYPNGNVHIQLKFGIYIHLRNKQFKFEFGRGSMILDKVISWMLEKFKFLDSTNTFVEMYVVIILATNMQYG
jgi:hypothetical protein